MIKYEQFLEDMSKDLDMTIEELEDNFDQEFLTSAYINQCSQAPPTFNFSNQVSADYYIEEKLELESKLDISFLEFKSKNPEYEYLNTSKSIIYHPGDIITYKTKPCTVKTVSTVGIFTFYGGYPIILPPQVVLLNNIKKIKNKHIPVLYSEIKSTLHNVSESVYFATFCDYFDMQESVIYQYIDREDQDALLDELSMHVDVNKVRKHR